jgi:hypothetical protein
VTFQKLGEIAEPVAIILVTTTSAIGFCVLVDQAATMKNRISELEAEVRSHRAMIDYYHPPVAFVELGYADESQEHGHARPTDLPSPSDGTHPDSGVD